MENELFYYKGSLLELQELLTYAPITIYDEEFNLLGVNLEDFSNKEITSLVEILSTEYDIDEGYTVSVRFI